MGFFKLFWEVTKGIQFTPPIVNNLILGRFAPIGDDNKKKIKDNHALISVEGDNFFIEEMHGFVYTNEKRIKGRISLNDVDQITLRSDKGEVKLGIITEEGLGNDISNTKKVYRSLANSYGFPNCIPFQNTWFFFDRNNSDYIQSQYPDEMKIAMDIRERREFREKEKLRNYFKIYFYFNKAYLFSSFEKVLKVVEESGIKNLSGKITMRNTAFDPDNYSSYQAGKIVLYIIGEKNKDLLLSHLRTVKFDSRAFLPHNPMFVRKLNNFIVWNQGGHRIRNAVGDRRLLNYYFFGKNFELIKEERLE
ncbi:hypothetical protein HN681_00080 [archaeon]|jgi:hypothetical protein|nr:hypothetical protein [archaeon]MBT3730668.1 hypothetical protein [archaeon]MBT4669570.1 hypothetical protein [archaeon]MBT5030327.1 hypothetical protein [archaeon]MBT5288380.1 hypothetical protein [archaeon]